MSDLLGPAGPPSKYDLAADAILSRPNAPRPVFERVVDMTPKEPPPAFVGEFDSLVRRMVNQIRRVEESNARALLRAAYDAGADAVSMCCGCGGDAGDEDFNRFIDKLIQETS